MHIKKATGNSCKVSSKKDPEMIQHFILVILTLKMIQVTDVDRIKTLIEVNTIKGISTILEYLKKMGKVSSHEEVWAPH